MTDSAALLRMLEPAVRPVTTPGSATPAGGTQPIESRDFDSLLDEARSTMNGADSQVTNDAAASSGNILSPLSDMDAIGNASLRKLRSEL